MWLVCILKFFFVVEIKPIHISMSNDQQHSKRYLDGRGNKMELNKTVELYLILYDLLFVTHCC